MGVHSHCFRMTASPTGEKGSAPLELQGSASPHYCWHCQHQHKISWGLGYDRMMKISLKGAVSTTLLWVLKVSFYTWVSTRGFILELSVLAWCPLPGLGGMESRQRTLEIKKETPSWMVVFQILLFSNLPATANFSESLNCYSMCSTKVFSCILWERLGGVCLPCLIQKWNSPGANIF